MAKKKGIVKITVDDIGVGKHHYYRASIHAEETPHTMYAELCAEGGTPAAAILNVVAIWVETTSRKVSIG